MLEREGLQVHHESPDHVGEVLALVGCLVEVILCRVVLYITYELAERLVGPEPHRDGLCQPQVEIELLHLQREHHVLEVLYLVK